MGNYSTEDKEAFRKKDQLNARQSSLKAASTVHEGSAHPAEFILNEADKYYQWLSQDQEWKDVGQHSISTATVGDINKSNTDLPTPTVVQKEWLDKIEKTYGFTAQQVYEKCGSYPSSKDQATSVVRKLKG